MRAGLKAFFLSAIFLFPAVAQSSSLTVKLGRAFFNPSLGQKETIEIGPPGPGKVTVQIVDRDGYSMRWLAQNRVTLGSHVTLEWDGRDQSGRVVPDEAYSLKIASMTRNTA